MQLTRTPASSSPVDFASIRVAVESARNPLSSAVRDVIFRQFDEAVPMVQASIDALAGVEQLDVGAHLAVRYHAQAGRELLGMALTTLRTSPPTIATSEVLREILGGAGAQLQNALSAIPVGV